ncbi:MAG TPA: hypothetical protein VLE19_15575 [Pyrinomonadaceae bacterium]|nr:hypothetical protein [Pyrinomonadaceae bacterium]
MRHTIWLALLLITLPNLAQGQSCNPASVFYIVRDEQGKVVSVDELASIAGQLPKTIGDATTAADEVSFTSDKETYYWHENADYEKGSKVPALLFANAATCTMHLGEVTINYHGKLMRLIFNIDIDRTQKDRQQVIDSLRLQNGTFQLDLKGWSRERDKLIPATHWKNID